MYNSNKVDNFCREHLLEILSQEGCSISDDLVLTSSNAGICMERLGLIKSDWAKSYISHRGGSYRIGNSVYCFRDILDFMDGKISDKHLIPIMIY